MWHKDFYLPTGILCLEPTSLHWFLFRDLYVIKNISLNLFSLFCIYYHSSDWRLLLFRSEDSVLQGLKQPQFLPWHLQVRRQQVALGFVALQLGRRAASVKAWGSYPSLVFMRPVCVYAHWDSPQLQQSFVQAKP